jgi:PTH1 family peptidyl-tRNA hydrolase
MALFQKKPQVGTNIPLYSTGLQQTKLIIGLGNPGKEYDDTRHNIGAAAVDKYATSNDLSEWRTQKDLQCLISNGTVGSYRVIAIKPTTFMNLSGESAQKVAHFYKIPTESIIAVYDELDIPFGQLRSRMGGSSAGHNGVKSLIQHLSEGFGRIRIGIRNPETQGQMAGADFVLARFAQSEEEHLPDLIREASSLIDEAVHGDPFPVDTRTVIIPGL